MGGKDFQPSRVEVRPLFPLEPGIAITIHKAQGRTIQKIILSLSKRYTHNIDIQYAALYVALSRVRCKEDIRLFLHQDFSGVPDMERILYINSLKPDKSINAFFEGYKNDNETWNAEAVLNKYKSD